MDALLVIDVQRRFGLTKEALATQSVIKQIADNIVRKLRQERLSSRPIIFVVYGPHIQYQLEGDCTACIDYNELADFVEHRHHKDNFEPVFFKIEMDAFSNLDLAAYLKSINVGGVTLLGCATYACVLETTRGALKEGFNVTLIANCVFPPILTQNDAEDWMQKARDHKPLADSQRLQVLNIPAGPYGYDS